MILDLIIILMFVWLDLETKAFPDPEFNSVIDNYFISIPNSKVEFIGLELEWQIFVSEMNSLRL